MTVEFENQMMHIVVNPILMEIILKIFPLTLFWEGFCTVSGTIAGKPVSGDAYTELTHSWDLDVDTQDIQQIIQER